MPGRPRSQWRASIRRLTRARRAAPGRPCARPGPGVNLDGPLPRAWLSRGPARAGFCGLRSLGLQRNLVLSPPALHLLDYRAVLDAKGKHLYDAWQYNADSGAIFKTGTTKLVADIIQGSVECDDKTPLEALEEVVRINPPKPKKTGKKTVAQKTPAKKVAKKVAKRKTPAKKTHAKKTHAKKKPTTGKQS